MSRLLSTQVRAEWHPAVATAREALAGVLVFAGITATAAAEGGYFPPAWGWSALGFLVAAFAVLVLDDGVVLTHVECAFAGGLALATAWAASSLLWSPSAFRTVQDVERDVVYVSAVFAVFALARRSTGTAVIVAVCAAVSGISAYALATRLLPGRFGYAGAGEYQLSRPVGYWNALAVLAAIGIALAVGLASRLPSRLWRAAAAAVLPVLASTLYFTFSRGGWLVLLIALVTALALESDRLGLAWAAAVLAAPSAGAVWLASSFAALTSQGHPLSEAVTQGHECLAGLAGCVAASALLSPIAANVPARIQRISAPVTLGAAAAIACVAAVAAIVALGGPQAVAGNAYDAFRAPPRPVTGNLQTRLVSVSGHSRLDYWRVAWREYAAHPLLGSGAGTFEPYWTRNRPTPNGARFAHSLYLETLAELGPAGLVLLCAALAVPLAAVGIARRAPLGSVAVGAYVAFLVHLGLDWDWQVPAVALTGLFVGAAVVLAARSESAAPLSRTTRAAVLAFVAVLAAAAYAGWAGNRAVARSDDALQRDSFARSASDARAATRWQPWSSEARRALGLAQLGQHDVRGAHASFARAVEKDQLDWEAWYDLALVSRGRARATALAQARRLNPLSPEVRALARTSATR